jgi:hypothetical protein
MALDRWALRCIAICCALKPSDNVAILIEHRK